MCCVIEYDGVFRPGQLMAMASVDGGAAAHILSPSVFNYLIVIKPCEIIVECGEVPDNFGNFTVD